MNRIVLSVLAWGMIAAPVVGQGSPPAIYAESFRHGATQVTEDTFDVKLTPQNASYHQSVKDSQGKDRYELTITPQMPGGDDKITSWAVTLRDLRHSIYGNLLMAQQEPSDEAKNNLGWLNPNQFCAVPIRAKRIMKVEGFYVVIQVSDLHFTPLDSPYLDSMTVQFALANTDPRASH